MKKFLFLFVYFLSFLPLWATQIYLPAYQNVVELQSGDTVRLDTAGTYHFYQTVDTLYEVLILSEVKYYVPGDTTVQEIIIDNLNIKNHNMGYSNNGNCCVRLEDSIGIATYLYAEGMNVLCPGLSFDVHSPSIIGCGIRVNSQVPSMITGSGTLIYAPQNYNFFRPELSGCLIGICSNSAICTISVDRLSTTHSDYFGIQWGSNTQVHIQTSKYGGGITYGGFISKGSHITVDADSCASLSGSSSDSLFVYRGNINSITGFDYVVIGVDSVDSTNIHIKSIGTLAPNYTKVYSGIIDRYYSDQWTPARLDLYGGAIAKAEIGAVAEQSSDTIFYMTRDDGGDPEAFNLRILDGSRGRIVIDGGTLGSADLQQNIGNAGLEIYNHEGNVYFNHGEIRIPSSYNSILLGNFEQDTLYVGRLDNLHMRADTLVGLWGNDSISILVDTAFIYYKSIINHGKSMLLQSNVDDYSLHIVSHDYSRTYIPLLRAYNPTIADSLYTINPEGKNDLTIPYWYFWDEHYIWDIYPAYRRLIHYKVGDGIAPKDSTYQEGLVRYFTTIPTRTDYDFMGWYADSLCTIRVDSLNEWSRGDTTLWAKWELIPERLTYETCGIKLSNQKELRTRYSRQQQFAIPDALPKHWSYDFHGWHADSLSGPIVKHTADTPLVDMKHHILYGDFTREIPSLSIMIAQGNCLAVRNPEGYSELASAHYTWVHQDTIVVNGVDSIISDTLPSHKMYIEVGNPIPKGRYTAIIHFDDELPLYVTRYIPSAMSSYPLNSNTQTLFYIGSYMLEVDDKGKKYLIML